MKPSFRRLQQRYGQRHVSEAVLCYEQTLQRLVDATGDGTAQRDDHGPLDIRLKENEVYAVRCDDNENYYRTVMLKRNGLTGSIQNFVSNPVFGSIPPGIQEVSATQVLKQMREFNARNLNAFPFNTSNPLPGQIE